MTTHDHRPPSDADNAPHAPPRGPFARSERTTPQQHPHPTGTPSIDDHHPRRAHALPRRTILRGLGVAIALPWLEAMTATTSRAVAARLGAHAAAPPLRMAFIFTPNGVNYPNWRPTGAGTDYTLSPALQPLAGVRQHLNILTGLTLDKARANGDGPGDHARSSASFLTGRQARKTNGNDIQLGVSVDQFAAQQIGQRTRLASLEIGCEHGQRAGTCDSGYSCAYTSNIAWRDENTPVPKTIDPAVAFETLFGTADQANAAERLRRRRSVLDYVRDDSRRLEQHLGANDRRKLDQYQTAVRELERRIEHARDQAGQRPRPDRPAPDGIPRKLTDHLDLMYDMLLLAFQTDATRIATFMTGVAGSNRTFPEIDVTEGHHHLSHHQNDAAMVEKIQRIDRFYVERFARFVQTMAATPEGEGSLLDNCMLLFGSGISDGNRHDHANLPIVMAGRAGATIDTGRLIDLPRETPLCNLYVSMLDRMGCQVESFGDSTGALGALTT